MSRLSGKVAVITGGNSGIGYATAQRFLDEGAQVVITGRRQDALDEAKRNLGDKVLTVKGDMGSLADLDHIFTTVKARFGRIDVLFLNAGIAKFDGIDTTSEALFDETLSVNLKGPYFAVQKALPLLSEGASVIFNTSATNQLGMPGASAYAASKAALRSLARTFSAELAPRKIRFNCLSPGPIETPIYGKLDMPQAAIDDFARSVIGQVPAGRFGTADEMAGVAVFLASADSSYVVGTELVADGGMTQI